jgi:hypothetical protein
VRTITDRGFKLLAEFQRVTPTAQGAMSVTRLDIEPCVVEGLGAADNEMAVTRLSLAEVQLTGLSVGDWVVLRDEQSSPRWPEALQGMRVGTVSYVGSRIGKAGFAEVRIKPQSDLMKLRTVRLSSASGLESDRKSDRKIDE